jgi:predicted permease
MDILLITFQSVGALLGIGVLGFWIIAKKVLPENLLGFLSTLAIDIALPCLVVVNILVDFSPEKYPDWWKLPLWWLFFSIIALALTLLTMFFSKKETRREFGISLYYQNGIFFPLIIITGLLGKGSPYIAQLFLFIFLHPSVVFGTYHLFFGKQTEKVSWGKMLNPVLITTLLALAIRLLGLQTYLPGFVINIFQMLGAMSLPLLMIILGGNIYVDFKRKGQFDIVENTKFVLVKNIIFPLVFLGILIVIRPLIQLDYGVALIVILQSAVPPITAIPVFAERCGGNRTISGHFIVTSFIFSIISIPLVLYLFNLFFPMP